MCRQFTRPRARARAHTRRHKKAASRQRLINSFVWCVIASALPFNKNIQASPRSSLSISGRADGRRFGLDARARLCAQNTLFFAFNASESVRARKRRASKPKFCAAAAAAATRSNRRRAHFNDRKRATASPTAAASMRRQKANKKKRRRRRRRCRCCGRTLIDQATARRRRGRTGQRAGER